ncbi:MAG: hypothetical protein ACR2KL_02005 [Nocardioidaceae bacterium]
MWRADGDHGGQGGGWWLLLDHPGLLVAIAVVLLVLFLSATITVWVVVRRLRRSALVARGLLQLKAQGLPPGPGQELAALRLSLRRATDDTVSSVALAEHAGRPVGDLPMLVQRLVSLSSDLDQQLRLLEREPDPVRLRVVLPTAKDRTTEVTATATRIRSTLDQFEAAETGGEIAALTVDVETEVTALQAGVESLRGFGGAGA